MVKVDSITKGYLVCGLACLMFGFFAGYALTSKAYINTADEQVEYVESLMKELNRDDVNPRPYLNREMKVGVFIDNYFRYRDVSKMFLMTEIERVCGYKPEYIAPEPSTFEQELVMFCNDVCSE